MTWLAVQELAVDRVLSQCSMEMSILENSKMASGMGRASTYGLLGMYTLAIGRMATCMDVAGTSVLMGACMMAAGRMARG